MQFNRTKNFQHCESQKIITFLLGYHDRKTGLKLPKMLGEWEGGGYTQLWWRGWKGGGKRSHAAMTVLSADPPPSIAEHRGNIISHSTQHPPIAHTHGWAVLGARHFFFGSRHHDVRHFLNLCATAPLFQLMVLRQRISTIVVQFKRKTSSHLIIAPLSCIKKNSHP